MTTCAFALPAAACDMHGLFGGFGNGNYSWKPYNPGTYSEDPAVLEKKTDEAALITPIPSKKTKPSFSNAANRAALVAKANLAKKAKADADKTTKTADVKKPL